MFGYSPHLSSSIKRFAPLSYNMHSLDQGFACRWTLRFFPSPFFFLEQVLTTAGLVSGGPDSTSIYSSGF